jgi:hypothetical protein
MKTKTSNARNSVEVPDVRALNATVNEGDMRLHVSHNHIKLCFRSQNPEPFFTLLNFEFRSYQLADSSGHAV